MQCPKPKRLKDKKALDKVRKMPCLVCGQGKTLVHHIRTVGSGAGDVSWNLMPLCFRHHEEIHHGTFEMAEKYPKVKAYLIANGWVYDFHFAKWYTKADC